MQKLFFILIFAAIIIIPLIKLVKKINRKCPVCKGKLIHIETKDTMGLNIFKKISFSIYQGPRKLNEQWICQKCGNKVKTNYWSN